MSKLITVYGSLKKDRYNHIILVGSKFLRNTTVTGTLYSLGSYPALVDEGNSEYDAEVYEVDEETYASVSNMERWAGYKEVIVDDSIVFYATDTLAERCKESYKQIDSY